MKKILTISIASYNAEKCLSKCLDSLVCTSILDKLEIIIVNDGSSDNTLEIAKKYKEKYNDSIIIIDKENGGHGSTINSSIKIAKGKYYKTLDSDDWVDSQGLVKLVKYLETSNIDLVINPHENVNSVNNKTEIRSIIKDKKIQYNYEYKFEEVSNMIDLAMSEMTFKTSKLKKMNYLLDEKCFYVDVEYTIYPIKEINNIIFLDYVVYEYLVGQINQSTNLKNQQKRESQHLRVIKSILQYYDNEKLKMSNEKCKVIENRILSMICVQYYLYMTMNNKIGKIKIKEFDQWLNEKYVDLYNSIIEYYKTFSKKQSLILALLRKTKFKTYMLIMPIYNLKKILGSRR